MHKDIGAVFSRNVEAFGSNVAILSHRGPEHSYQSLGTLRDEVAGFLRNRGIGRQGRVVILLPSGSQAAALVVAVACSAIAVPMDIQLTPHEIEFRLRRIDPDLLILGEDADENVVKLAGDLDLAVAVPGASGAASGLNLFREGRAGGRGSGDQAATDSPIAVVLQSSGTTGIPKLVPLTHANVIAAATRVRGWYGLTGEDRCLCVAPIWHNHGLFVTVLAPLLSGGSIAFPADPHMPELEDWLVGLKPTWYSAGPTLHRRIFEKAAEQPDALSGHRLRLIVSGGMALPEELIADAKAAFGVPLFNHYGSSEGAQISSNVAGASRAGSCGIPLPGVVSIWDENGPVPPGTVGRVMIGGETLFPGYLDDPELNAASFRDGWFRTGDAGRLDEDGFLFLHERLDDIINRGSEKISPEEIELALAGHPAVLEAAAFGTAHPRLGQDVAAAVVLRAGMQVSAVDLRRFLATKLAPFKVPRKIIFLDSLPRGRTGKVQRFKLGGAK